MVSLSLRTCLLLLLSIWGGGYVMGQEDSVKAEVWTFTDSVLSQGWQIKISKGNTSKGWLPQGIPFWEEAGTERELRLTMDRPDCLPDSLYLIFERIPCKATLEFNELFLGVHDEPAQPWKIALSQSWFKESGNQIILRLKPLPPHSIEPAPFVGMLEPAYLVAPSYMSQRESFSAPASWKKGKVAIVTPYYGGRGWQYDTLEALRILRPVVNAGIHQLYFPFPPDKQLRALMAQLALQEVTDLQDSTPVAFINPYPIFLAEFEKEGRFWLDSQKGRTPYYGSFTTWGADAFPSPSANTPGFFALLLLLAPLGGAFLIRLLKPGFFFGQFALLLQPGNSIDSSFLSGDGAGGRGYLTLTVVRIVLSSATLALGIKYSLDNHLWGLFSWFEGESLLYRLFAPVEGLEGIWLRAFLLLLLLEGARYVLVGLLGSVFRMKDLVSQVMGLDIAASYPIIFLMSIPLALLWVQSVSLQIPVAIGMGGLLLLYWGRRIYLNLQGLGGGAFSLGMKILYVCTFNIALLLIWL